MAALLSNGSVSIHVCADMAELSEGAVFDLFEALNIALTKWEKQNFVNLYTRCSRLNKF